MAKAPLNIRSLARAHTGEIIKLLMSIARKETASDAARVSALVAVADRGWGKPKQIIAGDDESPPVPITVVERRIITGVPRAGDDTEQV